MIIDEDVLFIQTPSDVRHLRLGVVAGINLINPGR